MANLFDSPWKIMIVAVVIIVMFGSRKLPAAAQSLGKSMRILKKEVSTLHEDEPGAPAASAPRPAARRGGAPQHPPGGARGAVRRPARSGAKGAASGGSASSFCKSGRIGVPLASRARNKKNPAVIARISPMRIASPFPLTGI